MTKLRELIAYPIAIAGAVLIATSMIIGGARWTRLVHQELIKASTAEL